MVQICLRDVSFFKRWFEYGFDLVEIWCKDSEEI